MQVILTRLFQTKHETIGKLEVFQADKRVVLRLLTLELPFKLNVKRISCIPIGLYYVVPRTSEKFGKHFHVTNVVNRDLILFHAGNFHTDILGCILVAKGLTFLDDNGEPDLYNSTRALVELLSICPNGFELLIQ